MKTNVSIKFNSIEEYREIERVLEELGYVNDKTWNEMQLKKELKSHIDIDEDYEFSVFQMPYNNEKIYNSLKEFLKDYENI